jgi:hypothetical protein
MIPQILRTSLAALGLLLFLAAPVLAQESEPMPPPAPEPEYDEPESPALPPPPEPAAKPDPEPAPAPAPAPAAAPADPTAPVVRVQGGEWGFSWVFGGLATLSTTGPTRSYPDPRVTLSVTEVAVRYALSEVWRIKFGAGTLLAVAKPDGGDASTNWGMALHGGFEYHFRIWRRISPFLGARMGFSMLDPSGEANWVFGIGLGPQIGIEYFIADRVSLAMLYQFMIEFQLSDPQFNFIMATSAGGSLALTVYF